MSTLDNAIDDLIAAASAPEARRAFEIDVARRKLEREIDSEITAACRNLHFEMGCN